MNKKTKKNPRGAGREKSEIEMSYKHFRLPLQKRVMLEDLYPRKELNDLFNKWIDSIIDLKK